MLHKDIMSHKFSTDAGYSNAYLDLTNTEEKFYFKNCTNTDTNYLYTMQNIMQFYFLPH